jgi:hypothetical protein
MQPHGKPRPIWLEHKQHAHLKPFVERLPAQHRKLLGTLTESPEDRMKLLREEQDKDFASILNLEEGLTKVRNAKGLKDWERSNEEHKLHEQMQELHVLQRKRSSRIGELIEAMKSLETEQANPKRG